jgi:hypothetical protein
MMRHMRRFSSNRWRAGDYTLFLTIDGELSLFPLWSSPPLNPPKKSVNLSLLHSGERSSQYKYLRNILSRSFSLLNLD